jgi:DNA-binding transcriptional MocR family regulator
MTNLLLYQRIAQQLADDIRRGVYQPGERVPSVRKMSAQLNVSHATVLQAYANLEDQGLIRARPQSGYYVHQTPALTAQTPDIARVERPGLVTRASIIQQVLTEARRDGVFPFGAAVPHVDYLPVRALHQQIAKVTRFHSPRAFSYMFSPGFEPLRRQIAIRMRDAGVLVDPREVVVTHGCVDALQMSLRVLTRPGDLIAAESPTYYGLLQLADLLGLKVIEIPSDPVHRHQPRSLATGGQPMVDQGPGADRALEQPAGRHHPEERQKQLLRLASDFDIQIVEDDIYGELMFEQGDQGAQGLRPAGSGDLLFELLQDAVARGAGRLDDRWPLSGRDPAPADLHHALGLQRDADGGGGLPGKWRLRPAPALHPPGVSQEPQCLPVGGAAAFPGGYPDDPADGRFHSLGEPAGRVNTQELHVRALEQGISIAPGLIFSNTEQFNHCIRLNCGIPWNKEAERAVMTLGLLAQQLCRESAGSLL